jgi:hypothetical protein
LDTEVGHALVRIFSLFIEPSRTSPLAEFHVGRSRVVVWANGKISGLNAGAFGGVAGLFALFFFSDVPRVKKDILQVRAHSIEDAIQPEY